MLSGYKLSDPEKETVAAIGKNASEFRDKAGDICRQLAFAGIATVWLSKLSGDVPPLLPSELARAAVFLVGALALDLLEYALGTLIWSIKPSFILRAKEQKAFLQRFLFSIDRLPGGTEHLVSRPVRWIFWSKIIVLSAAYCMLLIYLAQKAGFSLK